MKLIKEIKPSKLVARASYAGSVDRHLSQSFQMDELESLSISFVVSLEVSQISI